MVPALYEARVDHLRTQRMRRGFRHRIHLWLVDLDDLPRLPRRLAPLARFESRDHMGDPDRSIKDNLLDWVAEQGVAAPPEARVWMLAHARCLGYVFNPISVFWCWAAGTADDDRPLFVVAEVHNTYGGRHRYLLLPDAAGRAEVDKAFYVSPFLTVEGHYRMRLPVPDERLAVSVALVQDGRTALTATISGDRRPATPVELIRMSLRTPFVTHRTSALIRRHGIALWLRRLPVVPRRPVPVSRTGPVSAARSGQESTS